MKFLIAFFILFMTALTISLPHSIADQPAPGDTSKKGENWSSHFQSTIVTQGHGSFTSPYSGQNSLSGESETRTSVTSTLFLARRLWSGSALYFNPEIAGGSGISSTRGVAGFPNGEIYRVDSSDPKLNISRLFIQQVFGLGGGSDFVGTDKNQMAGYSDKESIKFTFGKFSLNDYFDNNSYSHDPRTQFLNWGLMDNGAWDYAADTRGYTWGFYFEFNKEFWTLRFASVLEPDNANQTGLDLNIHNAHADNAELEMRYHLFLKPGALRLLYFVNHAFMGSYHIAMLQSANAPDVTLSRDYRTKYGYGLNLEQELSNVFGVFSRWSFNDGATETWAFTEIEAAFSLGVNIKGSLWKRENDNIGAAIMINAISDDHLNYLKSGGQGFLIGDGKLNYAPEQIFETYYLFKPFSFVSLTADYQFVNHPAYNQDRGPASIYAARAHFEF
jgi:high affinity Mn2+ porin